MTAIRFPMVMASTWSWVTSMAWFPGGAEGRNHVGRVWTRNVASSSRRRSHQEPCGSLTWRARGPPAGLPAGELGRLSVQQIVETRVRATSSTRFSRSALSNAGWRSGKFDVLRHRQVRRARSSFWEDHETCALPGVDVVTTR